MPFANGKTLRGWAVISADGLPWQFKGIFESKEEAESLANSLGSDFVVKFGENQEGTDNFLHSS